MTTSELIGKGLYSAHEAAHIIRVPAATLRRWMFGYQQNGNSYAGLWKSAINEVETLSFYDLLELKFVHEFRQHGLSLSIIREAARLAREEFGTTYPFTRQKFHTDGEKIFLEAAAQMGDSHLVDIISKQYVMDKVYRPSFLASIDYSSLGTAERWYPLYNEQTSNKIIVLDPARAFGKPILTHSGVPTRVLYDAFRFDNPVDVIAANYELSNDDVKQAIMYESSLQGVA